MKKLLLTCALIGMSPSLLAINFPWQTERQTRSLVASSGGVFGTAVLLVAAYGVYRWLSSDSGVAPSDAASDAGDLLSGGLDSDLEDFADGVATMRQVPEQDAHALTVAMSIALATAADKQTWERALNNLMDDKVPPQTRSALLSLWGSRKLAPPVRRRRISRAFSGLCQYLYAAYAPATRAPAPTRYSALRRWLVKNFLACFSTLCAACTACSSGAAISALEITVKAVRLAVKCCSILRCILPSCVVYAVHYVAP